MPVVVVESPAKAKTINKYLGDDYTVLASFGHVRDLPPKDGSVDTEADFEMKWEVAADSKKHVKAIRDALASDPNLILLGGHRRFTVSEDGNSVLSNDEAFSPAACQRCQPAVERR